MRPLIRDRSFIGNVFKQESQSDVEAVIQIIISKENEGSPRRIEAANAAAAMFGTTTVPIDVRTSEPNNLIVEAPLLLAQDISGVTEKIGCDELITIESKLQRELDDGEVIDSWITTKRS